jgi:hypothetical protein
MDLKQIKFSLAVVINLLAALTFGYFCFLGANFYTLGDKGKSIAVAVIITLLLIGTSLGAKLLKQTKRNFKSRFIWEIVLLVLFSVLTASFTYYPFSHYFVVSAQKPTIQKKLSENIAQAQNIYLEYENYVTTRIGIYSSKIDVAILNIDSQPKELEKFGISRSVSVSLPIQKKNQIDKINYILLPQNFNQIKTNDSTWLTNAQNSVVNWEPISLVDVINNIENNTANSLNQLVKFSEKKGKNESYPKFSPDKPHPNNVKNYFTTIGRPSPFSIVLAFFSYLLMLLSWFITKRDSRSTGALTTAEYEIVL